MRIFLIRHGLSEGNEDPALYRQEGDPQVKLTDTGWLQAIRAGAFLKDYLARHPAQPVKGKTKPVLIWCSPFRRTRETAAGLIEGADGALDRDRVRMTPRLTEMSFGLFAHFQSHAERARHLPLETEYFMENKARQKFYARPPSGESPLDVQNRAAPLTDAIRRERAKGYNDHLLITHGVTLCAYAMDFMGFDPARYDDFKTPENCSIYLIEGGRGKSYSLRKIFNGKTGQEVDIDLGASLKGVTLPDVPAHLKQKP